MKIKLSSIMVENQATALAFYTDVLFSTSIHGEETHLAQRDLEFSDHSAKGKIHWRDGRFSSRFRFAAQ